MALTRRRSGEVEHACDDNVPEGGAKSCHCVGGPARWARKRRLAPCGSDLVGGSGWGGGGAAKPKGGAKPTLPVPSEVRWGTFHGGAHAAVNRRDPEEARELRRA
uniref:Uncharacterized protein n=1 Tax=Oryza meridionalis TaxID=40149 RepID=A0A0E0EVA9_9ORYZ